MRTVDPIIFICSNMKCAKEYVKNHTDNTDDPDCRGAINSISKNYKKYTCTECKSRNPFIKSKDGTVLFDPTNLTMCKICGQPIPLSRLKVQPGAQVCVPCGHDATSPKRRASYPRPPPDKKSCPRCGSQTVVRENRVDGEFFLGCTKYPSCHWTAPFKPE